MIGLFRAVSKMPLGLLVNPGEFKWLDLLMLQCAHRCRYLNPDHDTDVTSTYQLIPQIIINFRRHNTIGLQRSMMLLWACAGVPLGAYNVTGNFNIALQIQPQILTTLSLITWIQCYYYEDVSLALLQLSLRCWSYLTYPRNGVNSDALLP